MSEPIEPVFLVGAERSGTTVLRLMLDEHPEIGVCSEFEYVVDPLVGRDDWPAADEVAERLRADWIFQDHAFEIDASLAFPELAHSFLEQVAERSGKRRVVAVVHRHVDQLRRIWRSARYVHIVRDPRDVAASNVGMGWAGNVWYGVDRWIEVERCWQQMRSTLPAGSWLEVRQEELIAETPRVLAAICEFVGVGYDARMLDYPQHTTYSAPDKSLVEQWKRNLSPRELGWVEAKVGSLLADVGYAPSGVPARMPSPAARAWLALDDLVGRHRFRARRMGPGLWAADLLSRRLGLDAWQQRLEPRRRAVWKSGLK